MSTYQLALTSNDASALAFFGMTAGNVLISENEVNAWVATLNGDVLDAVLVLLERKTKTDVSERAAKMAVKARKWAAVHGRPALPNERIGL